MRKSICRQTADEYRSIADTARSEDLRSLLLTIASEWDALADAAARRSRHRADYSGRNAIAAKQHYHAVA